MRRYLASTVAASALALMLGMPPASAQDADPNAKDGGAITITYKDDVASGNTKGIEFLFKKNKIDAVSGAGRIVAPGKVEVTGADGGPLAIDFNPRNLTDEQLARIAHGEDPATVLGLPGRGGAPPPTEGSGDLWPRPPASPELPGAAAP